MNLTDADTLKFMCGVPILIDDICAVYPATLQEIVETGYDKFQMYLALLTSTKPSPKHDTAPELQQILEELTDFQYLLMVASVDKITNELLKGAFRFFCHEEVIFSLEPAQIVIGPIQEKHLLTEDNFQDLQHILRRMYFIEQEGDEIIIHENDSPAVKKMKRKMIENREKVRLAKARQASQDGSGLQFSDLIGSITINDCGLNMQNIWQITYYALQDQLKRMGWRDQFDLNNRAALAGAKIQKNQLKHWMRAIASSDKT